MTSAKRTRKTCALPVCSQRRGECMHCACDGRCGRHTPGLCGLRREGNGRECRHEGCARDAATCRHSRRATCSHCRYATATASSRKRLRARDREQRPTSPTSCDAVLVPSKKRSPRKSLPGSSASSDGDDDDDGSQAQAFDLGEAPAVAPRETARALCEYAAWATRRETCNLIVLVHGVQFNLHKSPMLLRSRRLHAMTRARLNQDASTPVVLKLTPFPGDDATFEALCVFAYTGELSFSPASFASLACAIDVLEFGAVARELATNYLHSLPLSARVTATLEAFHLAERHRATWPVAVEHVLSRCVDAVACGLPCTARAMEAILVLPRALFVRLGRAIYALRAGETDSDDELVETALLAVHYDADFGLRAAAQRCAALLEAASRQRREPAPPAVAMAATAATGSSWHGSAMAELSFQDVELLSVLDVDSPEQADDKESAALDPIEFLFHQSADVSSIEIFSEVAASG
ncbi:hypothetical protein P43SY_010758 [Pythium insidiosum]|uniref:BTB domain-containing protein n=1 Tax=Pythium insidiosum TaxID=114742 RepID=A0AAD5Q1D9_PYTIN|nr:hypothetical protein P43SY_010758 [Pythium insidiosum]